MSDFEKSEKFKDLMALFIRKVKNKFLVNFSQMNSNGNILSKKDFRDVMQVERERAERSSLAFSMVVLDPNINDKVNLRIPKILNVFTKNFRKIDHVGRLDKNKIGILLPYTSIEDAKELIARVGKAIEAPSLESVCFIYIYPFEEKDKKNGKYS